MQTYGNLDGFALQNALFGLVFSMTWNPNGAPCFIGISALFWGAPTFKNRVQLGFFLDPKM